ncbi:MAG: hypothetical protein IKQ39_04905 [Oscillospiraceae bacterium]|nr:hypothetical protein [Oscillospiraceae bacterium]
MPEMKADAVKDKAKTVFKRLRFRKPTRTDLFYLILSFLIAFFFWVYIAAKISPDTSVSLSNIPVVVDIAGTKAAGYDLSIIDYETGSEGKKITVNCTIRGSRTSIGGLTRSDVVAYVDFDSTVTDTIGTQILPIKLRAANGREFDNYSISKNTMEVTMDHYKTVEVPVLASDIRFPNQTYDDEVVIDTEGITVDPQIVKIYGPSAQLSAIDHIRVTIDDSTELSQSYTYTNCDHFDLVDAEGNSVSESAFQVQATGFSVSVPVYYVKKLPVTIELSNVPDNFDKSVILKRIRLNNGNGVFTLPGYGEENLEITVRTEKRENKVMLDNMDSWPIEPAIPLYSLSIGCQIEIPIKMIEGYTDASELGTVYVTLDSTDLVAKTFVIKNSDIQFMTGPSKYKFALQSPAGNTIITLVGTKEALSKIETSDIHATFNPLNISELREGTEPRAFNVTLPDTATEVWVSPLPKVNITVSYTG